MSYEYQYVRFKKSDPKSPYSDSAIFVQRGGYNEVDGLPCTLNSVVADDYRLIFNTADHVVLPDVLNKQVGKNTSVGMWVKPSQEWLDNGGQLFLVGNSDENYQTSYIFPFIYYLNDYQDASRMRIGVDGTGSGTAFQRFYDRSEFVAGRWYYFVFSTENDGEAEFDGKPPFSENNYASPQFRTDTILRLKNVSNGLLEVWGLVIWDGDKYYSTMSVEYPLVNPPDSFGDITFPDGSNDDEFIICTQPDNLGYGASGRKIFNKALSISDISYNAENGISNLQNCKMTISNTGQFYQLMRELNGFDFWPSLQVDIYWASGRVPTLIYDGADWKEDGETLISFTPDETYPLIDSIKKEFSGRFDSGSISKDTATFNLVSQEKMDSYKIGTIESMFGADSSKGKINPIVIGDMTNEFAYVPVILDRSLYDVPTAICSDIDLSEQPTLHIYDDEAERYYDVLNEQTFIDNRKIAFVDDTLIESVTAYTTGHVVMSGDITAEKILKDENGEYFGRFGDNLPYVSINKTAGGAFDYLAFIQNDYSIQRTYEGTRNYTGTTFENGKTVDSLTVSKDMAKARALVNLEFKPVVFYNVPDEQEDFDAIASAEFYTRVTKAGGVDTAGKPYQTNAIGTGPNPNSSQQMASTGRVKDVLNYEDWESTNYPHSDVTNLESPLSYLIFAPVHGVWSSNALDGNEYSLWSDYNYYTFSRQRLGFDLTPCKFDGDVKQFNININGGFYSKFYWGDGEPDGQKLTNSEAPSFAFSAKNENTNALDYHYIESRPITITSEFDDYSKEIKSTFQLDWFSTINGIKNSSPSIVMQGWSITSPFNVISGPRDYSRGRFGRNYFALDGVRLLAQASLNVESKYWCFKGKTASTDLITCLNELGAKYGNTTYVGTGVTGMKISGAIIGDPIYYRDVIAKVAEEFYCFVYDKNGVSHVVKKGSGSDVGNIDESNIIGPWVDNISFSETPANEIYDRFVVRYNYNHMTGKYGSFLEWNPDLFSTEISSPSRVSLYEAQQYLSKIGQSGKTKTVDLQFVRDVDTAVNIGEKWVQNIVRQRPKVTINVSKNVFLNMNIGDKFYLNLDVPSFYKTYYSVTKIVNRSNKTLTIEGEAFN